MRATRAYLAGLGTAGTLVLAASILFVLGSAIVTYNGWPKLGGIGSPATQTLTAHPKAGSHAARGLASVAVVKPQPGRAAGVPAAVANKRSTLLAQVGNGTASHSSAHRSTSGTISRPVAGRQPTRSPAPTKTGSGSGSTGSGSTGTGSTGSGSTGTGSATTTVTTPTTPVVATPTPIASTPTTPVSTGSGSGSGSGSSGSGGSGSGSSGSGGSGGSGSGGGSGSSNPAGTVVTVVKPGSGTVIPPPLVGTRSSGTPVVRVTSGSSSVSSNASSTSSSGSSSSSTSTTTSTTSSSTGTTSTRVSVSGTPLASRTGSLVSSTPQAH